MEYCITSNFNLFDSLKIFSPWLLALMVYLLWHRQKEKEVIADEAKSILKIIDELKKSHTKLWVHYFYYVNHNEVFNDDNFQKSLCENRKISEEFISKIEFLLTVILDSEISKIYEVFKVNNAYFITTRELFKGTQNEVDFLEETREKMNKDFNQLKINLVGYAMYKKKIKVRNKLIKKLLLRSE